MQKKCIKKCKKIKDNMDKKSAQNSALKSAKNSNLLLKVPKIVPKKGLKIVSSY